MIIKGLESGADHIEEIHAQREGRQARHLSAPAAFIRAIVASGGTQAPKVAGKTRGKASPPSLEIRLSDWLANAGDHFRTYLLPAAGAVSMSLARKLLILVIDSFDGVNLWGIISHRQRPRARRTAKRAILYGEGEPFRFDDMIPYCMRGEDSFGPGVLLTCEKYKPANVVTRRRKGCKEPIHLAANLESPEESRAASPPNAFRSRHSSETIKDKASISTNRTSRFPTL